MVAGIWPCDNYELLWDANAVEALFTLARRDLTFAELPPLKAFVDTTQHVHVLLEDEHRSVWVQCPAMPETLRARLAQSSHVLVALVEDQRMDQVARLPIEHDVARVAGRHATNPLN